MDTSAPYSLHDTEGSHYTSTYVMLPDPARRYIVYMDTSDNVCGAQLIQKHNGVKFPIAFLSHTSTETQRKWSTPE